MVNYEEIINSSVRRGIEAAFLDDTWENRLMILTELYPKMAKEFETSPFKTELLKTAENMIIDLETPVRR
jgi:hypothetical protein